MELNQISCFLLDMDGTLYLGDRVIDGALEFVDAARSKGKRCVYFTNNSSKAPEEYVQKLRGLGFTAAVQDVFTSGEATALYLRQIHSGGCVYLVGTPSLERQFEEQGFQLWKEGGTPPDFVVLGFDTTLTYQKLWAASDFILDSIPFIATHADFVCPLPGGRSMPDAGSMIELFKAATGVSPTVIGKPNRTMVDLIAAKLGIDTKEVAMIGDRLYTDIALGQNAGITTALVFSGETSRADYQRQTEYRADYQFDNIGELIPYL